MYYTGHNHGHNQGHNHTLQQIGDLPSHEHCGISYPNFEKDDFVINISKGNMMNIGVTGKTINDNIFLNNMCDCIVSRFAGHDINLFKAGNSNELKEMILNFLKKET